MTRHERVKSGVSVSGRLQSALFHSATTWGLGTGSLTDPGARVPLNGWSAGLFEVLARQHGHSSATGHTAQPIGGLAKRAFDVMAALILVVVLTPLLVTVATLIRLVMGGPVIFAQQRIGFGGRTFACYKFRTMGVDADEILERHLATNPGAAAEWRDGRKLLNDPRVGCLARILRKSSLDELPQLINVLRGDMSLVGPRPVVSSELECYGMHAREYLMTRPGITGLWQTNGRNRVSYSVRVALDRYYARRWSPWLDLALLIKTIPAVLSFDETG